MNHSEVTLIAIEDGRAIVSTDELYRVVKMPDERIVGELMHWMKAVPEVTKDGNGVHGAWRIALSYELCRIVEQKGVCLNDIAIQPIGKDCCLWCGAHGLENESPTEYECGTFLDAGWSQSGYSENLVRTEECEEGERRRHQMMVEKSATLRQLLIDAGEDLSADKIWLFDGRPAGGQFVKGTRTNRRSSGSANRMAK